MSMCENVGALVLYQVVARLFEAQSMNYAFAGGMAVTIGLAAMVNQQYNRSYAALPKDDTSHHSTAGSAVSSATDHTALHSEGGERIALSREHVNLAVDMQDLRTYRSTTSDLASNM